MWPSVRAEWMFGGALLAQEVVEISVRADEVAERSGRVDVGGTLLGDGGALLRAEGVVEADGRAHLRDTRVGRGCALHAEGVRAHVRERVLEG